MKDIKEITEQLEQGVKQVYESERYKAYLDFMSKFYDYSVNNIILIMMQNPNASLVAGYQSWKTKFNRQVKKGEKGITILAPCPKKFTKIIENEDGTKEEKEVKYMTFRACTVFDISQTEGEEVPSFVDSLTGNVENFEELLQKLTKISPVPVDFEYIKGSANGYFHPVEKRIAIKNDMSEQQIIKTLIHEISHAKLHDHEDGVEKDADRRTKEVQAESIAYTVCKMIGLETSDYSFGYVAGWSKDKEAKELTASMEIIRNTAKEIYEELRAA